MILVPSPHSQAMMPALHHLKKYKNDKILVGWHLLPEIELPEGTIIYNTEQLKHHPIPNWLKKYEWWEYSDGNLLYYKNMKVRFEPLEQYEIEKPEGIKSDILFYGSMNDRRRKIIKELENKGLDVKVLFGIYEEELYPYIAGTKIVLDLHFYEQALCNAFRILPALSLNAKVISEIPSDNYYYEKLKDKVIFGKYEDLVDLCLKNLN